MAKFVVVDKQPKNLNESEHLIVQPRFTEIVKKYNTKGKGAAQVNGMRNVVNELAMTYAPDAMSFPNIPYVDFEGVEFDSYEQLEAHITAIVKKHCPHILDASVRAQVKKRPMTAKTVYFLGDPEYARIFVSEGLDMADNIDDQPKRKAKKEATMESSTESSV